MSPMIKVKVTQNWRSGSPTAFLATGWKSRSDHEIGCRPNIREPRDSKRSKSRRTGDIRCARVTAWQADSAIILSSRALCDESKRGISACFKWTTDVESRTSQHHCDVYNDVNSRAIDALKQLNSVIFPKRLSSKVPPQCRRQSSPWQWRCLNGTSKFIGGENVGLQLGIVSVIAGTLQQRLTASEHLEASRNKCSTRVECAAYTVHRYGFNA